MNVFARMVSLGGDTPPVCRLGLATRGNTHLPSGNVRRAIEAGVNYLNWCGTEDGLSQVVGDLSTALRERVVVAVQLAARTAREADRELAGLLRTLGTEYIDVVTFYYVQRRAEWDRITGTGGAMEALVRARQTGKVRLLGISTHQRKLAAELAGSGPLDLLMVRYNAAHRGAESDVFPVTKRLGMPVVTFTGLRWGALLEATPDAPPEFVPPGSPDCYRFVLSHPGVAVALMAPNGSDELTENLSLLADWKPLSRERIEAMRAHGDRVHRHAGSFP